EDGMPTRMQVFVWDGADDRSIGIGKRKPAAGPAAFGNKHFTITAPAVLAADATAPASDACQPLVGAYTGQVVVADRGSCTFKTKALNAQNAGAAALIIADNAPAAAPPSLGDDAAITTPITIGVLSVTQADGAGIKADLAAGPVSATVHRTVGPDLDGTLDATVIGHEFGHSLHHRVSVCNTALCGAMSEGWADFSALLLVVRKGDNYDAAFPMAGYSTRSFPADPVFYGIRRAPYSNNHAINGLSFRHMQQGEPLPPPPFNGGNTANNNEVHNGGEVWASMLWEGYSALLDQPGADFDATRLKMRQYVVAGLQLAPPNATPTETRDAILAAVHARSQADFDILAAAFARRGFGSCAVSPDRNSVSFIGVVESFDVKGKLAAGQPTVQITNDCDGDGVLDGGETARVTVTIANPGAAALADTSATLATTTPGVHIMTPNVAVGALAALGQTQVSFDVQLDDAVTGPIAADFTLTFAASNGCDPSTSSTFSLRLNTDDTPASSASDSFDAGASPWTPAGRASTWTHDRPTPLDGVWHGADVDGPSDASLISPVLTATSSPVTISFSHAFQFEGTAATAFDGGVIEYSTDGVTWQDIAGLANPGYNVTLTGDPLTTGNALSGRPAFGVHNAAFPATDTVTLSLGTALAGQSFQIRFRVGSDSNTGAAGWTIDNLVVTGITGTPFPTLVADAGECGGAIDAGSPGNDGGSGPGLPDAGSAPFPN
ncbi:MAG TPA: M36 family metallopeptidase, partial [Kofleriaceae bacterium]|nr:M36 family metallopeptidase [Kofleriaceae bacterium]